MRVFALAFVIGTLGLQQAAELPTLAIFPLGVAALLAVALVPARLRAARLAGFALAGVLAGVGAAAWRAEIRLAEALPRAWEGEDVELVRRHRGF